MTLTKSWLQKQITDLEATRDEIPFGLDEDGNNTLAALKMALTGMEAEPVGYMNRFTGRVFTLEEQPGADTDVQVYVPVYTAPPAPASVPDEVNAEDCPAFVKYDVSEVDEAWARGFNACRAAMLQGKAEPVSLAKTEIVKHWYMVSWIAQGGRHGSTEVWFDHPWMKGDMLDVTKSIAELNNVTGLVIVSALPIAAAPQQEA